MTTLLANFYTLQQETLQEQEAKFEVLLNAKHEIYEGHFPDQPVMPGVCMLQLVTELTGRALGQHLYLKKANQAKFLIPIVPQQHPKIQIITRYTFHQQESWKVTASIQVEEQVFFKFKGLLSL